MLLQVCHRRVCGSIHLTSVTLLNSFRSQHYHDMAETTDLNKHVQREIKTTALFLGKFNKMS